MSSPSQKPGSRAQNDRSAPSDLPSSDAQGPVADLIRRFAALGLSGFFQTEGALRKAFGDTVPQDWVDFANDQSERGRQELFDRIAAEMGRVLDGMDPQELIDELLTGRTIEIEAKIRIGERTPPDRDPDS